MDTRWSYSPLGFSRTPIGQETGSHYQGEAHACLRRKTGARDLEAVLVKGNEPGACNRLLDRFNQDRPHTLLFFSCAVNAGASERTTGLSCACPRRNFRTAFFSEALGKGKHARCRPA